jgi:hypothetical protein
MALEEVVDGGTLSACRRGLLQHAVDSMVRRRGEPGSVRHAALREQQAAEAARPTHHALAQVLLARLSELPEEAGLPSVEWVVAPVAEDEARRTGVTAGSEMPAALCRMVERALSAPIGALVERGVIPSAEVLAELVPQLVASATAVSYRDEALRSLMAAVYRAFRNRRSLLLLNLEHQVRLEELPWVRAVAGHRRRGDRVQAQARDALVQLGELALQGFPGTILPNPLIQELGALTRQAIMDVPLVEELAADIFMGTFSAKFLQAAQLAGELLEGTLYERYYGIDYAVVRSMKDTAPHGIFRAHTSSRFASMCVGRTGRPKCGVAANGMRGPGSGLGRSGAARVRHRVPPGGARA